MDSSLLSFLPLLLLLVLSLWLSLRWGVIISLLLTLTLFFWRGAEATALGAVGVASFFLTLQIIAIVLGALLLHATMLKSGLFEEIREELHAMHPSKDVRFFLIAMVLTCFFEGVAGFGTPGAIVPPMLVALGYPVLLSVACVLLFDAIFVLFGAVGAPISLGLAGPLGLSDAMAGTIGVQATLLLFPVGIICMFFALRWYHKDAEPVQQPRTIWAWFLGLYALYIAWSLFFPALASVGAALCCIGVVLAKTYLAKKPLSLRPWLPYIALVLLLLLPSLPGLESYKQSVLTLPNLFDTGITASLRLGASPFPAFLLVSLGILLWRRTPLPPVTPVFKRAGLAFAILFPLLAIIQMMTYTGSGPSMVQQIANSLASFGSINLFTGAFLGALGAFVAGSATVSNIMFGASQMEIARQIGVDPLWMLVLQTSGAALGNAICFFNIVAACTVVQMKDYGLVLRKTLPPIGIAIIVLGVLGMVFG